MGLLLLKWLEQCLIFFRFWFGRTVSTISGPSLHPHLSPTPTSQTSFSLQPEGDMGWVRDWDKPSHCPIFRDIWAVGTSAEVEGRGVGGRLGSGILTSHMMTFMWGYSWWPLCVVTVVFNSAEAGIRLQMLSCVWIVSWPPALYLTCFMVQSKAELCSQTHRVTNSGPAPYSP